jgi:hypothetical protein
MAKKTNSLEIIAKRRETGMADGFWKSNLAFAIFLILILLVFSLDW